ncbi:MAG: PIN domain-containing protein [Candidatus Riflebacteria bacterium]|nr:PIN domain-containing protein [Candidatus Riflebacteria bacterium]
MTIIDSSCWVEYYRPDGRSKVQQAVTAVIKAGDAATCGIIAVEILGFIARKAEFEIVSADFGALIDAGVRPDDFSRAVTMGRALRSHGVTVPATDLIIASIACGRGALLLHADEHFVTIASHTKLSERFVR